MKDTAYMGRILVLILADTMDTMIQWILAIEWRRKFYRCTMVLCLAGRPSDSDRPRLPPVCPDCRADALFYVCVPGILHMHLINYSCC